MIQTNGKKSISHPPPEKPQDWDKAVSAAYLWLLNVPQKVIAESVGVVEQTVHRWRKADWWVVAEQEAMGRWLHGLRADAMDYVQKFVRTDATTARWAAERVIPELAPPTQRHEVKSEVDVNVHEVRTELTRRIARLAERN